MAVLDTRADAPFDGAATRFAPSPSGQLHLGNARTALFNYLLARRCGGRFVLRIEDSDAGRTRSEHVEGLLADLRWLGLNWDAGPGREDTRGPYFQSARAQFYAHLFARLQGAQAVYPCYCTTLELEAARRAQRASGRPPRYAGTCRDLSAAQRERKEAQGLKPTLRFRVPTGQRIEFTDLVHGRQSFLSDDIGDFVIQRADGTAAFFFCNAVDDASMGITHVLRGEDHLANTPRQLLILAALEMPAPRYGHISLILAPDGTPLSKRHGATSVREFRERGYRPEALLNYLFRLGHATAEHALLDLPALAAAFDSNHLSRSSAHYDEQQLRVWQKTAVHHLTPVQAREWLAPLLPPGAAPAQIEAFLAAVVPNVILPEDAVQWVGIVFDQPLTLAPQDEQLVREAGRAFFAAAAAAAAQPDPVAIAAAARAVSGRKGAQLYLPLRLALTGCRHGPELGPLLKALPTGEAERRLSRFA